MANVIVLGYDGSDGADLALDEAVALALALDAELVVAFGYEVAVGGEAADLRTQVRALGERLGRHAAEHAIAAGVRARVVLTEARPAEALAEVGNDVDARMIVVGGYSDAPLLRRAVLGAVPHRLLAIAGRPVLIVDRGDDD